MTESLSILEHNYIKKTARVANGLSAEKEFVEVTYFIDQDLLDGHESVQEAHPYKSGFSVNEDLI